MGGGKSERSNERDEKRGGMMTGATEQVGDMSRVPRRGSRLNGHLDEDRTEGKRNRVKGESSLRRERERENSG